MMNKPDETKKEPVHSMVVEAIITCLLAYENSTNTHGDEIKKAVKKQRERITKFGNTILSTSSIEEKLAFILAMNAQAAELFVHFVNIMKSKNVIIETDDQGNWKINPMYLSKNKQN